MLKLVVWPVTLINRTWHTVRYFLIPNLHNVKIARHGQERLLIVLGTSHTFLFLTWRHVEIARYGQERSLIVPAWYISILSFFGHVEIEMYDQEHLLIVLGTCRYFLSLTCSYVEISRHDQKRFLIILGTSQYSFIPILWTCWNW